MSASAATSALALVGALYLGKLGLGLLLNVMRTVLGGGLRDPSKLGKWAVVTGATDGIGKAMSFELASKGMNVLLISRTESKLKACCEEISSAHPNVQTKHLAVDYSDFDEEAQGRVAAAFQELDGGLGVLVNNVGMSYPFPLYFHELSDDEVSGLLELNVRSLTIMTRLALPLMLDQRSGAVINIGSASGLHPNPLLALYSATKQFVETLTRSLATEYGPKGIHFQCHTPFFIVSKLSKYKRPSAFVPSADNYAKMAVAAIGNGQPVVNPHLPHRIAAAVMDVAPYSLVQAGSLKFHLGIRTKGLRKRAREEEAKKGK